MKNTILITGAHGFIGRYVAKEYKRNGYFVIGIGNGKWENSERAVWGIDRWYNCEITAKTLKKVEEEPEIIIHCAGSSTVGCAEEKPVYAFERTVNSLLAVLEYQRDLAGRAKLIYPSSAAVYGDVKVLPISEECALNPISTYGVHKKIAEDLCMYYHWRYDLPIIVIRLFSIYGCGLKKQLIWDACNKIRAQNPVFGGDGEETRDWLHVSDVAKLFYIARSDRCFSRCIVNGGSGTTISVRKILEMINSYYGGEFSIQFNGKVVTGNPKNYHADISAISSWRWKPEVRLNDGIKEYVMWYKEYEKI